MEQRSAFIESAKLQKAFRNSEQGQRLLDIARAVFRSALTNGLRLRWSALQASWPRLSERWAKEKARRKLSGRIWEMTGRTVKAITDNVPDKIGTKRGLRFSVNWRSSIAFVHPRAFVRPKSGGGFLKEAGNAEFQEKVLNTLQRGSVKARARAYEKKTGRSFGRKFKAGDAFIPPRPLLLWDETLVENAEKDVDKELQKQFSRDSVTAQ